MKWLAVPLVAGALWVNRTPLMELVGWNAPVAQVPAAGELFRPSGLGPSPAAPLGEVATMATMAPVTTLETIADPMIHASRDSSSEPGREGVEAIESIAPPTVSLIIHGRRHHRALIDGEILGVGDETRVGRIVSIQPQAVEVRSKAGHLRWLPLAVGSTGDPGGSAVAGGETGENAK